MYCGLILSLAGATELSSAGYWFPYESIGLYGAVVTTSPPPLDGFAPPLPVYGFATSGLIVVVEPSPISGVSVVGISNLYTSLALDFLLPNRPLRFGLLPE